jgi:hypothetical protein
MQRRQLPHDIEALDHAQKGGERTNELVQLYSRLIMREAR